MIKLVVLLQFAFVESVILCAWNIRRACSKNLCTWARNWIVGSGLFVILGLGRWGALSFWDMCRFLYTHTTQIYYSMLNNLSLTKFLQSSMFICTPALERTACLPALSLLAVCLSICLSPPAPGRGGATWDSCRPPLKFVSDDVICCCNAKYPKIFARPLGDRIKYP